MSSLVLVTLGIVIIGCFLLLATIYGRNSEINRWPFVIMSVLVLSASLVMIPIVLLFQFDRDRETSDDACDIQSDPISLIDQQSENRDA